MSEFVFSKSNRMDCFTSNSSVWTEFTPLAIKHNAINLG